MPAEEIGAVIADLRDGRWVQPHKDRRLAQTAAGFTQIADRTVIDASGIYRTLVDRGDPIDMYGDHSCIAPPWPEATVTYENEHGNIIVMPFIAVEYERLPDGSFDCTKKWDPADPFDWSKVRWLITTLVFCGGRSSRLGKVQTAGPLAAFHQAVGELGEPLDLHWTNLLPEKPIEEWDMAHLVYLGALTFLSARNVDIAEPVRPRAQQKRVARTGVRVHELHIFPTGRSTVSDKSDGVPLATAAHPVRGHFNHYGACCTHHEPRGLLFGKYTGKIWMPHHVRGSSDVGEISHTVVLEGANRDE